MVYDLDHNPATQPRMFGLEPDGVDCLKTFVGHGTWWNTRFARPLLCSEQLQEHGFPVEDELLEQLQLRMPLDWYFLMEERIVNNLAVSSMVGNGWSIPCMGAFIMYVFALLEPRAAHLQISEPLPTQSDSGESYEDSPDECDHVEAGDPPDQPSPSKKPRWSLVTRLDTLDLDAVSDLVCMTDKKA